jgi:DNA-binding transcriptional MerR regulator
MEPKTFSLDDLCTLTDFSKRTVRYYMQLGLVDRPIGETRSAHYLEVHVDQLLRIKKLTDAGVSLERIREVLAGEESPVPARQRKPGSIEVKSHLSRAGGFKPRASQSVDQRNHGRSTTRYYKQINGANMRTTLGLEDEIGQRVFSLKSVRMEGKLEGLLLTMQVSQRYRNDTDDTIEASYTFPAGWGANLLGFSVTLNGKQLQAIALAKKKAEENYEKAISDGDTPVMLEKSPLGLYTANLGNIKPNEEAVIDIEYAQLLRFEKGRVHITVPTVIGARYGDEQKHGHIAPHQSVKVDALVEYPFTARLDILGDVASGKVTCPSHNADISQIEGGKRIELTKGGMLDRDLIVTIEDLASASYAVTTQDTDGYAVIASFCPVLKEEKPSPLALKILVDCSGSMQGESTEQAQEA